MLCCVFPVTRPLPEQSGTLRGAQKLVKGLLVIRPEGKTASYETPQVDFLVPHRDVFKCPIAALGLAYVYAFDGRGRHDKWDWTDSRTFRDEPLIWGDETDAKGEKKFQKYGAAGFGACLKTMFTNAGLDPAQTQHLARHLLPDMLAQLGYVSFRSLFALEHRSDRFSTRTCAQDSQIDRYARACFVLLTLHLLFHPPAQIRDLRHREARSLVQLRLRQHVRVRDHSACKLDASRSNPTTRTR